MPDFESQIRESMRQVQEQLASFETRRTAIAEAVGDGQSDDGLVTAQVGTGGAVKDLQINPKAMRLPSESLRDSILEAIRAANEHLAAVLREHMTDAVDVPGLLKKLELPPEMRKIMDDFGQRAGDIDYNLSVLRRNLDHPAR